MKLKRERLFSFKKGQVTIFIIIAIIIVAVVLAFFFLREPVDIDLLPPEFAPVHRTLLSCIEDATLTGASVLGSQGGYIEPPAFEPGSDFMPFSSQLNFFGNPIPYWYYVSGNNIEREQVPSKRFMEEQLGDFIDEKIKDCNYNFYYGEGFEIYFGEPNSRVDILDNEIVVNVEMDFNIVLGEESVLVRNHETSARSFLGELYGSALQVYQNQQETLFLENYGMDVLWAYAPVDGVEITCSPVVHNADEVFDELQEAIEANTQALTTTGARDDYFNVNLPVNHEVRFLNSRTWPHSFEVTPTEGNLLVASPVGTQKGLGVLGFCYVAYHYVYDMKYPVLIQVFSGDEIFQFPMAVVIRANNPREPLPGTAIEDSSPPLCEDIYRNTIVEVNVVDMGGIPVEAEVSYECLGAGCRIGKTSAGGVLRDYFPQCVNGFVSARAEGYADSRTMFSTVDGGSVQIFMDRIYSQGIQLKVDGIPYSGDAIIYFESLTHGTVKTVAYPQMRNVELAEGEYEIEVRIFRETDIKIGDFVGEQCISVPRAGVLGILGMEEERCFDVEVSEQTLSQALSGGGSQRVYIFESDLISFRSIDINVESLPTPRSFDDLSLNELLFEGRGLEVSFV